MAYDCGLHFRGLPTTRVLFEKHLTLTSDEDEETERRAEQGASKKTRLNARRPSPIPTRGGMGLTGPRLVDAPLSHIPKERCRHDVDLENVALDEPLRSLNFPLYMSKPPQFCFNTEDYDGVQQMSTVGYSLNYEDSDKSVLSKADALSVVEEESEPSVVNVEESTQTASQEGPDEESSQESGDEETRASDKEEIPSKTLVDSECQTDESDHQVVMISRTTSCADLQPEVKGCFSGDASNHTEPNTVKSSDLGATCQQIENEVYDSSKSAPNETIEAEEKDNVKAPEVREEKILRLKSLEEKKIELRKVFRETSQTAAIFHKSLQVKIPPKPKTQHKMLQSHATPHPSTSTRPQSRKPHLSPVAGHERSQSKSPSPPQSALVRRRNASPRTQLTLKKCDPVITPKTEAIKTTIEEQLSRTSRRHESSFRPSSPSSRPKGHPLGQGKTLEEFRELRKGNNYVHVNFKK